jgi:mannosyltransferase
MFSYELCPDTIPSKVLTTINCTDIIDPMTSTVCEPRDNQQGDTHTFSTRPSGALRIQRLLIMASLLILGGALRFNNLGAKGLWGDEIWTAQWSQGPLHTVWRTLTRIPDMPLIYALVNISSRFGENEFWIRLPATLFGIMGLIAFYFLADLTLGRRTAFIAVGLMVISPIHIWYSQEARYYTQLSTLGIASLYFFYAFLTADKVRLGYCFGFVIATIAAIYTHLFAGWILAAQGIFALYYLLHQALYTDQSIEDQRNKSRKRALWLAGALVVIAICTYPVLLRLLETVQTGASSTGEGMAELRWPPGLPEFLTPHFLTEIVLRFSGGELVSFLMIPLFAVGFVVTWRHRRDIAVLTLCLVGTPILTAAFLNTSHGIAFKYFFYLLPVYLLLVAQGFVAAAAGLARAASALCRQQRAFRRMQLLNEVFIEQVVLLSLSLSVALLVANPIALSYKQARINDWRAIAAYLAEHGQPGDVILTERWGKDALSYYLSSDSELTVLDANESRLQRLQRMGARIWLIGLEGQLDRMAKRWFQKIPDFEWQEPGWIYTSEQDHIALFPITEPPAQIYSKSPAGAIPIFDFMDIDNAEWTDVTYRHVASDQVTSVNLSLLTMGPRALSVRYYDSPGKDFQIFVDGQTIGAVQGGFLGGWQTWHGLLPATADNNVHIEIAATGTEPIGLDSIELTYVSPPTPVTVSTLSPDGMNLHDQGIVIFKASEATSETTGADQGIPLDHEIAVLLSIPDQAARTLIFTTLLPSNQSIEVTANGYPIGSIAGSQGDEEWSQEMIVLPGGMGPEVLIEIGSHGPNPPRLKSLEIQPIQR